MVKPDPYVAGAERTAEPVARRKTPIADKMRQEGMPLFQAKKLIQKNFVSPLQLHDAVRMTDTLLLPVNSAVAVLTDPVGQTALEIAKLRPQWQITGWVPDTKTFLQLQSKVTPANLVFDKIPQHTGSGVSSLRAILAVGWAHRVFSQAHYHVSGLVKGVQDLLNRLPEYGQLLVQDYALPDDHDSFVTLDIGNDTAARELLEFSTMARPNVAKPLQGFFIEILPSPRAGVQRFHLPYKWAVEFFHRWRHGIAADAPYELTTLSLSQWASLAEQCGTRVTYRAPHALPRQEIKELQQAIRFLDNQGNDLPLPAESFTLLLEKIPERDSLAVYERRVSADKAKDILISGIRNTETDEHMDVVEIRHHENDVLPWYFDADMQLRVLVRTHVPRPIINAVPRGTPNLDGRHWAGYLIEPLTMPARAQLDPDEVAEYLHGLMPQAKIGIGRATDGVAYYPAPDYLVQRVRGMFVPVRPNGVFEDVVLDEQSGQVGRVVDVLADDVLRAISAGLIPDGKLEILIAQLMREQGIQPSENDYLRGQPELQRATKITKDKREVRVPRTVKAGDHMEAYIGGEPTEKLRAVRSVFVEEQATPFGRDILRVTEQDFIVPATMTTNSAICIPMTRDPMGNFLLSGEPRRLPIPSRMGSAEPMMHLPTFSLPSSVKNMDEARVFLAQQLQCDPDDLYVMGPSFFVQPQISAERVYPFLLNATPHNARWMRWYKPVSKSLKRMVMPEVEKTTAYVEFKLARDMGEWYMGFTPDVANQMTGAQPSAPQTTASMAHATRHPMVLPTME